MNGSDEARHAAVGAGRDFPILARDLIFAFFPQGGTEGSNPAPSTGESPANLSFGDTRDSRIRRRVIEMFGVIAHVSEAQRGANMGTLHGMEIPFVMKVPAGIVEPAKVTPTDKAMADLASDAGRLR